MKLIATRPVLYMGRTYHQGDVLPAYDKAMVAAWLRAGSAIERTDSVLKNTPEPMTMPTTIVIAVNRPYFLCNLLSIGDTSWCVWNHDNINFRLRPLRV